MATHSGCAKREVATPAAPAPPENILRISQRNEPATLDPQIAPHLAAMKAALAKSAGLLPDEIGLKATTNEGVDDIGRGLAIAAHAVCLISRQN